ncbi:MAG: DUF3043 domain-containing protein [Bifidobacteriaceae bacterium]|nr:DUF3043 domain-containing protein [Bifidobacteriaceae bacterium]
MGVLGKARKTAKQAPPPKAGGKGKPTPTRKQAEAAHKRPLGGAGMRPTTPLTKEQQKEQRRKSRERYDHAMRTADERYLPARDKGPVRRYTRDWIDSRRSIGQYTVPIAVGSLLVLFVLMQLNEVIAAAAMLNLYLVLFASVGDGIWRGRKLKKALTAKFGEDKLPRGSVWYGINRSFQARRYRMPNPQVKVGEFPE